MSQYILLPIYDASICQKYERGFALRHITKWKIDKWECFASLKSYGDEQFFIPIMWHDFLGLIGDARIDDKITFDYGDYYERVQKFPRKFKDRDAAWGPPTACKLRKEVPQLHKNARRLHPDD